MTPIKFVGATLVLGAPRDWNHETQGGCGLLHVMVKDDGEYISRWTFTEDEREQIAKGADIFLHVFSGSNMTQPPVMLQLSNDELAKKVPNP